MFHSEDTLPKMPVPPLELTMFKYLDAIRPMVDDDSYDKTVQAVSEFLSDDQSEELHQRLMSFAKEPKVSNWVIDLVGEIDYLVSRRPVTVNVSYYFIHKYDSRTQTGPSRAAALTQAALYFRKAVLENQLESDYARGQPLSMYYYPRLFNSSRVPGMRIDRAMRYDPTTHNHIAVIRKNKFYEFEAFHPDGRMLTSKELENQFQKIIELAGTNKGEPIGIMTSEHRSTWAEMRNSIVNDNHKNSRAMERIESAIFVVCLDDTKPSTSEEMARELYHSNGQNRFFDKQQFIIFENGESGFLAEHSMADGTHTLRMNDWILTTIAEDRFKPELKLKLQLPEPKEISFNITEKIKSFILNAKRSFECLVVDQDMALLKYKKYGKELIKSFNISPDAFVQMMMQLAYYRMNNSIANAAENIQMRKFQQGRVEAINVASVEAIEFIKSFDNPHITNEKKVQMLRAAAEVHVKMMTEAADGYGFRRYLAGLRHCLNKGESIPQIFRDRSYFALTDWQLSTSSLHSKHIYAWGFGECDPEEYAVTYSVGEEELSWIAATLRYGTDNDSRDRSRVYCEYLEMTADDMRELLESTASQPNQKQTIVESEATGMVNRNEF